MARERENIPMLDDLPADEDALGFAPYREAIAGIICDPSTSTPLTIGIFGKWGSGKTSLMNMIMKRLPAEQFLTLWFDAWKYDKEPAIWRVLLLRVLDALRADDGAGSEKDLSRLEEALYRDVEWEEKGRLTIDLSQALGAVARFTDSPAGCPLACWGEESGLLVAMNPWLRNARRRVQLRHERPETKPTRGL
jgi:hypothetical protein